MNKNKKIIFRPEWFAAYGLDKEKNFLQAPICECGCGGKCDILLDDEEALNDFVVAMLLENDCNRCAIFAHAKNGDMYAYIKAKSNVSDEPVLGFKLKKTDMDYFNEWDDELRFHCYGLMIETQKGKWKIIEN